MNNIKYLLRAGLLKPKTNRLGRHLFTQKDVDFINARSEPKMGSRNPNDKLTDKKVLQIYRAKGTAAEIARKFGISDVTVRNIKRGKPWSRVTGHKTGAAK
jgi:DNA invertase Pin-like site-specific DNA recombinase